MKDAAGIDYTIQIWQEGSQFIAHAMPIDVMSSGPTPDDAKAALKEAVQLFLLTTADEGHLADVLDECGYRYVDGAWVSPSWVAVERHSTLVGT